MYEKLDAVKEQIKANLLTNENLDGLLTCKLQAYMKCLELKQCDLEVLL